MTVTNEALVLPTLIGLFVGLLIGWLWYKHKFKSAHNEKKVLEDPHALLNELNKHRKLFDMGHELTFGIKLNEETGKEELTVTKEPKPEPKKIPEPE